jgi:hypothetical protein
MKTLFKSVLAASALLGVTATCHGTTLRLDGADDCVLTPNLRSFFTNETVTIEVWINARGPGVIVDERQATSLANWADSQIEIVATTNALQGEVRVRVWPTAYVSLGSVHYGTWNQAVLRYDKAALTLDGFLNGAKSTNSLSAVDRQAPWEANGSYGVVYALGLADSASLGSGAWFNGLLDEFRVWNSARSDAEIAASWNRRLTGGEPSLVAYYTLEEGAGTTIADRSGHGNSGALVNGVLWNTVEDAVAPVARTSPAASVTGTGARLNGWVNTNGLPTTNYFEWWSVGTTNETSRETVAGSNSVLNLDGFDDATGRHIIDRTIALLLLLDIFAGFDSSNQNLAQVGVELDLIGFPIAPVDADGADVSERKCWHDSCLLLKYITA